MIRLRVVGIFYDQDFSIADVDTNPNGRKTLKELLDLAVRRAGTTVVFDKITPISRFSYTSKITNKLEPGGSSATYNSLFGFTHYIEEIATSLGEKVRKRGFYKLFESTSVERDSVTVHAWQYYVIRKEKNNATSKIVESNFYDDKANSRDVSPAIPNPALGKVGFTPFDRMDLQEDDEVVWRNVSIVRNPQTEPIYQ